MPERVRLYLLGPVLVERGGTPVRGFESRKAIALLSYLALHDEPVARRCLAQLFWEGRPEPRQRGNLSRVLHNLNSLLPGSVGARDDRVAIQPERLWMDVKEFAGLTGTKSVRALATAVDIYRGELLAGLELDDCPGYQHWLDAERERWRRRVAGVLEKLVDHHTWARESQAAIRCASRLVALEPWREEGHRRLIVALARDGQRSAALAQYDACRRVLLDELGVDPAIETEVLHRRIREGPSRRLRLPAPATPLVGRERELPEIGRRLADPGCRLLTLLGPGGIGKTHLALEAARRESASFMDGVHCVELGGPGSSNGVAAGIADALGLVFSGHAPIERQLVRQLAGLEVLILLDAMEDHVDDGLDLLRRLLAETSAVKLLVTSRRRLNLPDESVLPVGGLDYPPDGTVAAADGFAAVRLFVQSARRFRSHFQLEPGDVPFVATICRLTDGMPLAIDLAAAGLRSLSCRTIARALECGSQTLYSSGWRAPARHRSLRAVFDESWGLLAQEEAAIYPRLCLFPGAFDQRAAVALGATPPLLESLVDKSFLRRHGDTRYGIHELLRHYGAQRLEGNQHLLQSARARYVAYYADFLASSQALLEGRHQADAVAEIAREINNIRPAWDWAVEARDRGAIRKATRALWHFYDLRGRNHEGREVFTAAVAALDHRTACEPDVALGGVLGARGWFNMRLGDRGAAACDAERSIAVMRSGSRHPELGLSLAHLGVIMWLMGDYDRAIELHEESIALAAELGDHWVLTYARGMLGWAYNAKGQFARARAVLESSLAQRREVGEPQGIAGLLLGLGRAIMGLGQLDEARRCYRESVGASSRIGYRFGVSMSLLDLATVEHRLGDARKARGLCERSLQEAQLIADSWGIARALSLLGDLEVARGDDVGAETRYKESLAVATGSGELPRVLGCVARIAEVTGRRGDWARASALARRVVDHPAAEPEAKERARGVMGGDTELDHSAASQEPAAPLSVDSVMSAVADILGPLEEAKGADAGR